MKCFEHAAVMFLSRTCCMEHGTLGLSSGVYLSGMRWRKGGQGDRFDDGVAGARSDTGSQWASDRGRYVDVEKEA